MRSFNCAQRRRIHHKISLLSHPRTGGPVHIEVVEPPLPGLVRAFDPAANCVVVRIEEHMEER